MKYKLLVLDIDGTIVRNHGYRPTQKVVNAITKAKERVKIVLCSGRTKEQVMQIATELDLDGGFHIIEGGTKVINEKGECEYEKLLSADEVREIITTANKTYLDLGYCIEGKWVDQIDYQSNSKITNVSLNAADQEQTERIVRQIETLKNKFHIAIGTHISMPKGRHVMLSQKGASKELGIKYVQRKLGIKKSETIGMGDMHNDLPIFLAVGLRIAVGDGSEELKRMADYIAPPIDKDPVADIIEKFIIS